MIMDNLNIINNISYDFDDNNLCKIRCWGIDNNDNICLQPLAVIDSITPIMQHHWTLICKDGIKLHLDKNTNIVILIHKLKFIYKQGIFEGITKLNDDLFEIIVDDTIYDSE